MCILISCAPAPSRMHAGSEPSKAPLRIIVVSSQTEVNNPK